MIQRWQSFFLLLAAVILLADAFFDPYVWAKVVFVGMGVCSFVNIFLFKRRKLQIKICMTEIAVGIIYYILLAVFNPLIEWYNSIPMFAVLLLFIARKRILMDEKLVRSLDRIR